MKFILALFLVFGLVLPAAAEEMAVQMKVIDPDPKGTNVRDKPSGKVIKVISNGKTEKEIDMRGLTVLIQDKDWFKVRLYDDTEGWMHRSVLGACASATEDGDPYAHAKPTDDSKSWKVPSETPLYLISGPVKSGQSLWAEFRYTDSTGKKRTAWFVQQTFSGNPYTLCHGN